MSFSTLSLAQRTALVIGNSNYETISPLKNPEKDAMAMSRALSSVGFDVIDGYDLSLEQMYDKIELFSKKLSHGGVGLFFFAGHGVNVAKSNFLIPTRSSIESEKQVPYKAINVDYVLDIMSQSGNDLNIVILDACRNNPFAGSSRSATRGLVRIPAPSGALIAYATAAGQTAEDGRGVNGTYTKHILEQMMTPDLPIELMFKNVREGVKDETNGRQVPMEHSSIIGHFSFVGGDGGKASLETLVNKLEGARLAKPVTKSTIKRAQSYYDQIEVIDAGHKALSRKNEQLSLMHERLIRQMLRLPDEALQNMPSLLQHFHEISILTPNKVILQDKNQLIAGAYLAQADQLYSEGHKSKALAVIRKGIDQTSDPRLLTREASFAQVKTVPKVKIVEPSSKKTKPSFVVRYRDDRMNCKQGSARFKKTSDKIRDKSTGITLAEEIVIDECLEKKWVYLNTHKTFKMGDKLCRSLGEDWLLASKDDLFSLITEQRYPEQGGMMPKDFFPSTNEIGPQQQYLTSTREGRKRYLVNAMNGTSKDTYNANFIGSVICISDI
jgi:hypothetical protein